MNQELVITSKKSGLPVPSRVVLEYSYSGQSALHEEELGNTDANGHIDLKQNLKGYINRKLKIYALTGTYSNPIKGGLAATVPINFGKKKTTNVQLDPNYFFLITLSNQNCLNNTDSAWLSFPDDLYANDILNTGCSDTICNANYYGLIYNWTHWTLNSNLLLTLRVNRNGITTESELSYEMIENEITQIHISY